MSDRLLEAVRYLDRAVMNKGRFPIWHDRVMRATWQTWPSLRDAVLACQAALREEEARIDGTETVPTP